MIPLRRGDGNQHLHRQSDPYRAQVRRKLAAYERHIQIGLIVQGLLQYLAVFHHRAVWRFFGSWLRTENHALAPSELVVAHALRNSLPDFLLSLPVNPTSRIRACETRNLLQIKAPILKVCTTPAHLAPTWAAVIFGGGCSGNCSFNFSSNICWSGSGCV